MFYGVIHEDYMFEVSLKQGIEAVKTWLHNLGEGIKTKAHELWEKAKKAKSAIAAKFKEIFNKAKALDQEIKNIQNEDDAKKVKTDIDETEERLETIQKVQGGFEKDTNDKNMDYALNNVNTAEDNAVNKAGRIFNKGKKKK